MNTEQSALRSVFTSNFPQLLSQIGGSLVVSTYQAGKVILVRVKDGSINTHFCAFPKPMGLVANQSQLIVGCRRNVHFLRNMPAVAAKLEPLGTHDACYVPRAIHTTGDIDIHEMAFDADNQLWLVNTRFSCLCTLDADHSFVPRWRPSFINSYLPEDRCHLNGLGMRDGQPRYVTALGTTDVASGWRDNKASGGVLIDITSDTIIAAGLSMPHSPRWYADRLWVLESGNGSLATVDVQTGQVDTVAHLPGFTRGIDFIGPYAFIGLSQVRESAVFSGIPLTEREHERTCGVWVVDIRIGEIVAFLRFEEGVQEIFSVQVLPSRFPDLLAEDHTLFPHAYVLPDDALAQVPASMRSLV